VRTVPNGAAKIALVQKTERSQLSAQAMLNLCVVSRRNFLESSGVVSRRVDLDSLNPDFEETGLNGCGCIAF
jgi:hypothetical protein